VLPPTSEPRFWALDGTPEAPREWVPMLMELPVSAASWERASVAVNGWVRPVQLQRLADRTVVVSPWRESPAGYYRIRWALDGYGAQESVVFVPPAKMSNDALCQLLGDLDTRLPYALAADLERGGALAGLRLRRSSETSPEAELARLRKVIAGNGSRWGLITVLAQVARDPHRVLAEVAPVMHLHRARRPGIHVLRHALCRAHAIDDDGLPLWLRDRRVESSVDVYENRLLRLLADWTEHRLKRLGSVLPAAADEIGALRDRLGRARLRASFLEEVTPLTRPPDAATMVLLKREPYRHAVSLWKELASALDVHLNDPALESPLKSVPVLYELWAALAAIEAALAAAVDAGFCVVFERLVRRQPGSLLISLATDGGTMVDLCHASGTRLRIAAQRSFTVEGRSLRSLSYAQRPDLVLELARPGKDPELIILDPKYKLEGEDGRRPKKEDIDKMHAYRDAIVDSESGRRVVRHAAILYPGEACSFGPAISAIPADPRNVDALREQVWSLVTAVLAEGARLPAE